jgi:hypothetical protein
MHALRAIHVRVVLLAIVAMLLHASSPALHVHARHATGDGSEWTEVCTGSGHTVLVRVDPATGDIVTAAADAADPHAGDPHCPQCLTHGGAVAHAAREPARVAVVSSDPIVGEHQTPDRLLLWSAHGSRAPPSSR